MRNYENYYNTSFADKVVRDGIKIFNKSLLTSPDVYNIKVNDSINEIKIFVQSTANYNERRILFSQNKILWGDIVIHENEKWLVTEYPFFNKIHEKSKIQLCNNTIEFSRLTDGVFEYDRMGNKIWIEDPTEVTVEFPCVLESISSLNTKTTTGEQINVPEGDMVLQISYTDNELIHITSEFKMFNNTYRISGIDRSKVHNNQGVLIIVVSRIANNA